MLYLSCEFNKWNKGINSMKFALNWFYIYALLVEFHSLDFTPLTRQMSDDAIIQQWNIF